MRRETDPVYMREGKIPSGNIPLPFPCFIGSMGKTPGHAAFPAVRFAIFLPRRGEFFPIRPPVLFSPLVPRKNSGPVLICVYFFAFLMLSTRRDNGRLPTNLP